MAKDIHAEATVTAVTAMDMDIHAAAETAETTKDIHKNNGNESISLPF